jgi:hypothetical protein
VAPFDELADPRLLAELAAAAEERGWGGVYPTRLPGPDAVAELTAEIRAARPAGDPFDVVVGIAPDADPAPWERAGATWTVTDFGLQPTRARVRAVIDAGPR